MARPKLSNRAARALFLDRHGLGEKPRDLPHLFDKLAFVQLDSINTVARAHHMILHARLPSYRPPDLDKAQAKQRRLFEHWTHDASTIDMAHFAHWQLQFKRMSDSALARWSKSNRAGFTAQIDPILKRIEAEGPLCSADVGEDEQKSSGGWWDWHPSKTALEYLWLSGQISVCHRKHFRKYYDLTERIIPEAARAPRFCEAETIDWACNQALDRLGFGTSGEIAAFFDMVTSAEARDWCKRALTSGQVIEIDVEGQDGNLRRSFARPDVLDIAAEAPTNAVRILSPFDPALRDRKRAERLFGFHYRIEVFVPAPKRQYGYYVFPILEGDRLIGRIDMKVTAGQLDVTRLWLETGIAWGKGRQKRLQTAIERTARMAGATSVAYAPDWLD